MRSIADVIAQVRAEFLEMPGLYLTALQVQRLCGIEQTVCAIVLQGLLDAQFLRVGPNGVYRRVTDDAIARSPMANASLRPVQRATRAS